jgi:hypothetical protein
MNISCLKTFLGIAITLSIPLTLRADNIVFDVLPSGITGTTNGSASRLGGPGCGFGMEPDACIIFLTPPSAGTLPGGGTLFVVFSEPGDPAIVSSSLEVGAGSLPFPPFIPFYVLQFSPTGPSSGTPCNTLLNGCISALTLDWFNNSGAIVSSDTITVESGTVVPEPSSIPWLLTALAISGVAIRQRKSAA